MFNLFYFFIYTSLVSADVYLHNPRGNNNRCDERSNNRNNANRLFDSQNNAAGGYAVTCNRPEGADTQDDISCYNMNYYGNSVIPIRWTSQHNCGENNHCQFILQYSCEGVLGNNVRDGRPQNANGNTCTNTIPEQPDNVISETQNIYKFGKNEDYSYYQRCKDRERNHNLFTADQKLKGNSAIYTRQNPNGNRYGFECPEERDYYPYWGETDWVDIAVLTTDTTMCDYYMNNSRCNQDKYDCVGSSIYSPDEDSCNVNGGLWVTYPKFENCNMTCLPAPSSIINRLGIGQNSTKHTEYHWKLPNKNLNNCVLRIRYNISTNETPWNFTSEDNDKLYNNPVMNTTEGIPVRLAINTAQYGRTFEDRTYTFNIIKNNYDNVIHNVNVQGKRGNIAQVRNCIEYDFVPNDLNITVGEYIHFQFIGSDYNSPNNDGEGRDGTDRSNLVLIETFRDNIPLLYHNSLFTSSTYVSLAALYQNYNNSEECFTFDELYNQNQRNNQQSLKNCALLNRAEPYFNLDPVKVKNTGKVKMMSSRNNNFSNRGQKLKIIVMNKTIKDTISLETNKDNNSGGNNNSGTIAISIIVSLLCIFTIFILYYKRKDIQEKYNKVKKDIKRSTATYV
jgi:hypothetical protein